MRFEILAYAGRRGRAEDNGTNGFAVVTCWRSGQRKACSSFSNWPYPPDVRAVVSLLETGVTTSVPTTIGVAGKYPASCDRALAQCTGAIALLPLVRVATDSSVGFDFGPDLL